MVHVFKRVSISDGEAEIRFFRVYGTPPTHLKVNFLGGLIVILATHEE